MTGRTMAERYLRKAERALDEARLLLGEASTEGSCSRAYYAMHDAAHAALLAFGLETAQTMIKTHQGLISELGRQLVMAGKLDASLGRHLNQVDNVRLAADYSCEPLPLAETRDVLAKAENFVEAVRIVVEATPKVD